jgi:hypothetical protein
VPQQVAGTDPARSGQAAARFAETSNGPIRVDLSRFTTGGFATGHGVAVHGLRVGDIVSVADEDSDTLRAEVVATRRGAADLRVSWERRLPAGDPTVPVVRIDLGPVQRNLRLVEITDVDLADGALGVADRVDLVDEGGDRYPAVVETVEPALRQPLPGAIPLLTSALGGSSLCQYDCRRLRASPCATVAGSMRVRSGQAFGWSERKSCVLSDGV